jgi:lysophospholipase L1-like esterase
MILNKAFSRLLVASVAIVALMLAPADSAIAEMPFADGQTVLVLGDSITQNGQYVALAEAYLWAAYPDRKIDVISIGLSSETVSGITEPVHPFPRPNVHDRLTKALDIAKPDWVVVCYGMNDGIYHPKSPEIEDKYRKGLTKLIDQVAQRGAKLVLLTPPSFDIDAPAIQNQLKKVEAGEPYGYRNPYRDYDKTLTSLGDVVNSLASSPHVDRVIDVHQATDDYLTRVKAAVADYAYGDGVHPPADGHLTMAIGLLAGLGCDAEDAEATLIHLTGLAPADRKVEATDEQKEFHKRLLDRFSRRSSAYRKAVGVPEPMKVDGLPVDEANEVAAAAEKTLRQMIAARPTPPAAAVYEPYAEAAEKRWSGAIKELETLDQTEQHPVDAILFVGSSSVRLWETIQSDMAPFSVIRRGYGGAKFTDLAVFAQRLITPHQYAAMVVFVANDVTGRSTDISVDEVERLARHVVKVSQQHRNESPVLLVEITPTASRLVAWPKIRRVNDRLREIALSTPNVYFVETADYYLDASGKPIDEYFKSDRLHQTEAGYAVWGALIKRRLSEVLAAGGKGPLVPDQLLPAEVAN